MRLMLSVICGGVRFAVIEEPPLHPWPQVAAELGKLEETRERIENANMDKLTLEFNKVPAHLPCERLEVGCER